MASYTELTIDQGATFTAVVVVNDDQGDRLNLYSYSASSQLRKSYYSTTSNNFTVSVSNPANGEITLSMSAANTANLKGGRYMYDLVITDTYNTKTRVIEGIAVVRPSITR